MYYDDASSGGARIGLSSVLLLIIFVAAAGVILAAVIWRPWFNEDTPRVSNSPAEGQVSADEGAVEGVELEDEAAAPVDAAPVEGVTP